jgi:predicted transcriptional regulator
MTEEGKLQPFLVRLRPATRKLLDEAAQAERRSRASVIDEALVAHLQARYTTLDSRLEALLEGQR